VGGRINDLPNLKNVNLGSDVSDDGNEQEGELVDENR